MAQAAASQTASPATLYGTVADPTGALIPNAQLEITGPQGGQVVATDQSGHFSLSLPPGTYAVHITATDFTAFDTGTVLLKPGQPFHLTVRLQVQARGEEMTVDTGGSSSPNDSGSALVFQGDRLNLLSDDNATLQQQLSALAGPGIGGAGVQFLINGFSGGRLPPKSSIRSIRIGGNEFSAYYDSLGFGRVEIDTKPGADNFHGGVDFAGTDQPLNANNPYTGLQPPYYQFQSDANLNGPLNKNTSFFISENVQQIANNAVVNAVNPLDTGESFSEALPAPENIATFALRVDHQFSPNNFMYMRDEWSQTHVRNTTGAATGLGGSNGFSPLFLPDAAFASNVLTDTLQGSDTQVLGPHAVNEVRFQYLRTRIRQDPNSTAPSLVVEGALQSGGNPAQFLRDNQDRYELQDVYEFDKGKHSVRAGFRFRELRDANFSNANFNGQYTFSSLAAYTAAQAALAAPGGAAGGVPGASQFDLTVGQPSAVLWNDDTGIYAEDDWKVSKHLTFSPGFRFESESAVPDHVDPAPRLGVNYVLQRGKAASPLLTLHGGYGIFYDRFPAGNLLQAIRQNGRSEIGYFVQNPATYPLIPAVSSLTATQPTIYRVNPALRSSYSQVGSIAVDREIGKMGRVSATYIQVHGTHGFVSQNVNAPLPGTYDPSVPNSGIRPLGTTQNIYQFNSDSNENDEIFFANANLQVTKKLYVFGFYVHQRTFNESAGSTSFASNQYDLRQDYARAAGVHPNTLFAGAVWSLPLGFQVQPFLNIHSGAPFDITTGTDLNGDTIYNDRPAFATDLTRASVLRTAFGNFDTAPAPGQTIIPRDYGNSPGFVWLDLQASKDFHVGPRPPAKAAVAGPDGKTPPPAARRDRPWDLKFQVEAQNAINHNNPGIPIGVLPTPGQAICQGIVSVNGCSFFGHSLSLANDFSPLTASNRTILFQSFFTF